MLLNSLDYIGGDRSASPPKESVAETVLFVAAANERYSQCLALTRVLDPKLSVY